MMLASLLPSSTCRRLSRRLQILSFSPRAHFLGSSGRQSSSSAAGNAPFKGVVEHVETAALANCRMEFRAGALARFAAGSVVLTVNENAVFIYFLHLEKLMKFFLCNTNITEN
jgi:hypothetical protein